MVHSRTHPDLHILMADSEEGGIQELRSLMSQLQLRPFYGGSRIVVISDAEHLSIQALNLLLKSLEEPAPHNHFILTTANRSLLPATVVSRCQSWNFERLSAEDLATVICRQQIALPAELPLEDAVALADGSLDNLNRLSAGEAGSKSLENWGLVNRLILQLSQGDVAAFHPLLTVLNSSKEAVSDNLMLLRICARKCLRESISTENAPRWATLLHNCLVAERFILQRNFNLQYVMVNLLMAILPGEQGDLENRLTNSSNTLEKLVV